MTTQPSYPNLRYYIPSYCLIYHYGVDLFFSGLSPEKKKYSPFANSASQVKRAVKNILSLDRKAKLGPSRVAGRFKGLINIGTTECLRTWKARLKE